MTTYKISAPHFVAALVEAGDRVVQAAPVLRWTVGKDFLTVRSHFIKSGWTVEPLPDNVEPSWLEHSGFLYELHWHRGHLTRITRHSSEGVEDISWYDLPDAIKNSI